VEHQLCLVASEYSVRWFAKYLPPAKKRLKQLSAESCGNGQHKATFTMRLKSMETMQKRWERRRGTQKEIKKGQA
jgi:hypothetical protein